MIDKTDFSLPADEPALPAVRDHAPVDSPAPMIVIEYRNRGILSRLMPPIVILLATIAIMAYQRRTPVPLAVLRGPAVAPSNEPVQAANPVTGQASASAIATQADPSRDRAKPDVRQSAPDVSQNPPREAVPPSNPEPLKPEPPFSASNASPTAPEGTPAAPSAEALASLSPFEFDPEDGLRPIALEPDSSARAEPSSPYTAGEFAPPAGRGRAVVLQGRDEMTPPGPQGDRPGEESNPAGEITKEEVLNDIEREAAQAKEQQKNLEELKPKARAMLLAETLARVQASRTPFRNELREALRAFGPNAGPEIDRICSQFGREMIPETKLVYYRAQRSVPKRMTRADEVNFMRACGLPEPVILDFLAHKLHKTINTRGGPRDENGVRINAAQMLLGIPLPVTRANAQPPGVEPSADPSSTNSPYTSANAAGSAGAVDRP